MINLFWYVSFHISGIVEDKPKLCRHWPQVKTTQWKIQFTRRIKFLLDTVHMTRIIVAIIIRHKSKQRGLKQKTVDGAGRPPSPHSVKLVVYSKAWGASCSIYPSLSAPWINRIPGNWWSTPGRMVILCCRWMSQIVGCHLNWVRPNTTHLIKK